MGRQHGPGLVQGHLLQMQMQQIQLHMLSWSLKLTCPVSKLCCQLVLFFCTGLSTETPLCAFKPCLQQGDAGPDLPSEEHERAKLFLQSLQIPPAQEQLIASLVAKQHKTNKLVCRVK